MPNALATLMILGLYAAIVPICGYECTAVALAIVAGFGVVLGILFDVSRVLGDGVGSLRRWLGARA